MNNIVKVQNHDVAVIEWNNERVVTSAQLAELYETNEENIRKNLSNNQGRFEEGKHFYLLKGDELKAFKDCVNNLHVVSERAPQFYLWTQRGASRHCKMLGTDKSWDVFDCLEESYFNPKADMSGLSPQLQALINIELRQNQQEKELTAVKEDIRDMRDIIVLNPTNWKEESRKLIVKIAQEWGGYQHIQDVYSEIYKSLDGELKVSIGRRLTNKRQRMAEAGACKTARDKLTKLDIIAEDPKLINGFISKVKDLAIKYGVSLKDIA
ncbi:MAG: ORF6N domain-containing protein [Clostridiales Family XIII bacterium]|nr:ORF6N domain-containing protein [Clostridia bacterium]MDY3010893.1 ORF6N domain-containing protein [Clostridiales Family XIII bacterium]